MKASPQISRLELSFILTYTTISLTPLGISAALIQSYRQNAWVIVLIAFLFGVVNLYVALQLAGRFPKQNIVEWSAHYLGKWGAKLYGILAVFVLFVWSILMFWEHWHFTTYTQLHQTPQYLPVILEMTAVIYLLTRGLEAWSRVFTALAPWAFLALIVVNAPQFINSDFARLRPVFSFESGFWHWKELMLGLFMFRSTMLLYYLYPSIKQANRLFRPSLIAFVVALFEIVLSIVLPVSIMGPNSVIRLTYPYQESLETVHLSALPLAKLSFVSPILWLIILVYVLASSLYCAMKGIKAMLPKLSENLIIGIIGIMATIILLFPIPNDQLSHLAVYWSVLGLLIYMLIPMIFWLIPHKKAM